MLAHIVVYSVHGQEQFIEGFEDNEIAKEVARKLNVYKDTDNYIVKTIGLKSSDNAEELAKKI